MDNKSKISISLIILAGFAFLLILLTLSFSYISSSYLKRLGEIAISIDKENTRETSKGLFLEITKRTAGSYSASFSRYQDMVVNLASIAERWYDDDTGQSFFPQKYHLQEYKDRSFYYLKTGPKSINGMIYWGSGSELPQVQRKVTPLAEKFHDYIDMNIMPVRGMIDQIWLCMPEYNIYLIDSFLFLDPSYKKRFYDNIPSRKYFVDYQKQEEIIYSRSVYPDASWHIYRSWGGNVMLDVFCTVYHENSDRIKVVAELDADLNKVIALMKKKNGAMQKKDEAFINTALKGFLFIIDRKANVLLCPEDKVSELFKTSADINEAASSYSNINMPNLYNSNSKNIRNFVTRMLLDQQGVLDLKSNDGNNIVAFSRIDSTGWILGYIVPEDSLLRSALLTEKKLENTKVRTIIRFVVISVIFLLLTIFIMMLVFRFLVFNPLRKIRKEIEKMSDGNFNIKLKEEGGKEIADLASDFNYLGRELKKYVKKLKKETAIKQAAKTEIEVATAMQQLVLPRLSDEYTQGGFQIAARLDAATDISGDFYDFFYLDNESVAVLIADVSGKGIQAAYFMGMCKALIKTIALRHVNNPSEALKKANNSLCMDNSACMFATAFLVYYNTKTGIFKYANAGHHKAIFIDKKHNVDEFGTVKDMALGFIPGIDYNLNSGLLNTGETILLYTDGVSEAVNPEDEQYGEERLINLIKSNVESGPEEIIDEIIKSVKSFEQGSRFDDMTLVTLTRKS